MKCLVALADDEIGTSDIPELTLAQLKRGVTGQMYRPIKKPVTMRLDADVIEWLKMDGPGYQTKANSLLRQEMLKSLHPANTGVTSLARKSASPEKRSV